jgi:4'-phosphopantetheinyl transferase
MDVDVFTADVRDHDCETWVTELAPDCVLRLARISHPGRRAQFILGRLLLRHALSARFGLAADDWRLDATLGKPRLVGDGVPEISLSHSRHLVACAVAPKAIGLDVEYCRERDFAALAAQFCGPAELHRFLLLPIAERSAAFYRIWTRMEATFKLNGGSNTTGSGTPRYEYFRPEAGFVGTLASHVSHPIRLVLHTGLRGTVMFRD